MNCLRASDYYEGEPPATDLHINSCGYFSKIDHATNARRTYGRPDFQLIGVVEGTMNLKLPSGNHVVTPGQAILFKPGEPQIYGTPADDCSSYYWIHFIGDYAPEILKDCSLYDSHIFDVGCSASDVDIICEMISEITSKPKSYRQRTKSLFVHLLTNLARRSPEACDTSMYLSKIRPAVAAMENGKTSLDIKEYANMCLMSEYYFMHVFKEATGMTPGKYKNKIVMEKAKTLVRNTNLSIKEISQQCGFSDPLYLSKKFKTDFGCTPTEYRARHRE